MTDKRSKKATSKPHKGKDSARSKTAKSVKQNQKPAAPPPAAPKLKRIRLVLNTALDVRREQSRVYREARAGSIDAPKASRLIWMLGEVRRTIETEDLEGKLKALASLAAAQGLK